MNFFKSLSDVQKYLVVAITAIVLFVASSSVSYSIFSNLGTNNTTTQTQLPGAVEQLAEDPNEPRTEICPLDGDKHTKKAKEAWEKRSPLSVMIENHLESRPQSGLSSADVVYEAVAEGGITRFMAVYLCNLGDFQVGPVRSVRTYFLDWLSEYNGPISHVGGANTPGPADALGQLIRYGLKSLNQFSIGFPTYWRDYQRLGRPVATEHTMYSTTQKLWDVAAKRQWTNLDEDGKAWDEEFVTWKFKDDASGGNVGKIDVTFWENQNDYSVTWNYDPGCNCYKRTNGGQSHTDMNNKQQLSPKNLIIQFQKQGNANDGYPGNVHLLYGTTGKGKALFFLDGKVVEGTWNKANRLARTKYLDSTGKEIEFNRGQIWIQTVPENAPVVY